YLVKKLQPRSDFFQNFFGHRHLIRAQPQLVEKTKRFLDGHAHNFIDSFPRDPDPSGFRAQASTLAGRAKRVGAVAAQKNPHVELVLFSFQVAEETADAGETVPALEQPAALLGVEAVIRDVERNAMSERGLL